MPDTSPTIVIPQTKRKSQAKKPAKQKCIPASAATYKAPTLTQLLMADPEPSRQTTVHQPQPRPSTSNDPASMNRRQAPPPQPKASPLKQNTQDAELWTFMRSMFAEHKRNIQGTTPNHPTQQPQQPPPPAFAIPPPAAIPEAPLAHPPVAAAGPPPPANRPATTPAQPETTPLSTAQPPATDDRSRKRRALAARHRSSRSPHRRRQSIKYRRERNRSVSSDDVNSIKRKSRRGKHHSRKHRSKHQSPQESSSSDESTKRRHSRHSDDSERYASSDRRSDKSSESSHHSSSSEDESRSAKKRRLSKEAARKFTFDIKKRTGKPSKRSRFSQRKPYMSLTTQTLARVVQRPSVDHLTPMEYVDGSLRMIQTLKHKGVDAKPYENHLREVVTDSLSYKWESVRAWSNEVFEQLETKQISWSSHKIQAERSRVSWTGGLAASADLPPAPCSLFNTHVDSYKCKLESGHEINGIRQLHTCALCFYGKGLDHSKHISDDCHIKRAMAEGRLEYNPRRQDRPNNNQQQDQRAWFNNNNQNPNNRNRNQPPNPYQTNNNNKPKPKN